MTSPEHTFFVNCKFCQSFISTGEARDVDHVNTGIVKFTCSKCNYRSEALLYTEKEAHTLQNKRKRLTKSQTEFEKKCYRWHGRKLEGNYAHYCPDWDFLPIDNTCVEFQSCTCTKRPEKEAHTLQKKVLDKS